MAADVTALLAAWGQGDQAAFDRLITVVHQELRRLAHCYMAGQRPGCTLGSTALVNEAFLRLVDCGRVMRRIPVDYARSHNYQKRGAAVRPIALNEELDCTPEKSAGLVALDDSLNALAEFDPRKGRVVELKFFGGLTTQEIAEVLEISEPSVLRDWKLAKSWLQREMKRA
jgi:RNA polymerase sigma factor (TIGR02999 family)